jgi:hypothetical protein
MLFFLGFLLTRAVAWSHLANLPFGVGEWMSSSNQGYTSAEYVQITLFFFFLIGLFALRVLDKRQKFETPKLT